MGNIYFLDFLRAISIIIIMLHHYTVNYDISIGHIKPYVLNMPYLGAYFGIVVFFVISGFLIVCKLKNDENVRGFLTKRFIRLYPSYCCGILLTSFVMYNFMPEKALSVTDIIMNFTMIEIYFGIPYVDGVYWTLTFEIFFYCFIGLVLYFKKAKKIIEICFWWIILSLVLQINSMYMSKTLFTSIIGILIIRTFAQTFIVGIVMQSIYCNNRSLLHHIIVLLCLLNNYLLFGLQKSLIFLFIIIVFYCFSYNLCVFQFTKIFKSISFVARISYPLYLIHQRIGMAIIRAMEIRGYTSEVYLILPIVSMVRLAWIIYEFVDKPINNFLKNLVVIKTG